jgi:hypothetical protein
MQAAIGQHGPRMSSMNNPVPGACAGRDLSGQIRLRRARLAAR